MAEAGEGRMTKARIYSSAANFRRALEERLNSLAKKDGKDIQTLRRQVAFDRLLARLFQEKTSVPWALKGGYAMELRVESARTTKDIDLAIRDTKLLSRDASEQNEAIREELQKHSVVDLKDYFVFLIGAPTMDLNAAPYGGGRFPVEVKMDNRIFISFHLDVGVGDVWMEPLDKIATRDWLAFASISAPAVIAISKEQQFAEKLHAYTLPRGERQNSRVKDLVDMVLLIDQGLNPKRTKQAIHGTFEKRKTHSLPSLIQDAPAEWARTFTILAEGCGLALDHTVAMQLIREFVRKLPRD
jgi:predicted nucleotidyltransferase component of viral defense system